MRTATSSATTSTPQPSRLAEKAEDRSVITIDQLGGMLGPTELAESMTVAFDPYTVSMPSGEGFFMITGGKVTWIHARDTDGHEVCEETFVFVMQTYAWQTGPPQHPDFTMSVYTLNRAGGLLDDWLLDLPGTIWCHTAKSYSFKKTFEPNIYKDIRAASMHFPGTSWTHCTS